MTRRTFTTILLVALLLGRIPAIAQPQTIDTSDIVILYDNDVHGAVEGYPLMASLRDQMRQLTPNVTLVSCGDYLSGTPYGTVSSGSYLVRLMNAVGYDYVTLGNHEFDFGMQTLQQRVSQLKARVLCCNFSSVGQSHSIYPSYDIRRYGNRKVAFIGITTPDVPTLSTPTFFQGSLGRWLYTFYSTALDSLLQCRLAQPCGTHIGHRCCARRAFAQRHPPYHPLQPPRQTSTLDFLRGLFSRIRKAGNQCQRRHDQ